MVYPAHSEKIAIKTNNYVEDPAELIAILIIKNIIRFTYILLYNICDLYLY